MTNPDPIEPIPGQIILFPSGPGFRATDPETSKEAAAEHPGRSQLRWTVLALIGEHRNGLCDAELIRFLPAEHPGSVTKRRTDLYQRGLILETGELRASPRGRDQKVWKVTHAGRRALRSVDLDWS